MKMFQHSYTDIASIPGKLEECSDGFYMLPPLSVFQPSHTKAKVFVIFLKTYLKEICDTIVKLHLWFTMVSGKMEPLLRRERRPLYRLHRLYRLEMYSGISVVLWKYADIVKVIRNYDWTLGLCWKILNPRNTFISNSICYMIFSKSQKYESQTAAFYDVQLDFPINYKALHSASGAPSSFVFAFVQYLPCAASTYKISSSAADIWTHSSMEEFFTFHFFTFAPLDCAMYQATLVVKTENFIMAACLLEAHV